MPQDSFPFSLALVFHPDVVLLKGELNYCTKPPPVNHKDYHWGKFHFPRFTISKFEANKSWHWNVLLQTGKQKYTVGITCSFSESFWWSAHLILWAATPDHGTAPKGFYSVHKEWYMHHLITSLLTLMLPSLYDRGILDSSDYITFFHSLRVQHFILPCKMRPFSLVSLSNGWFSSYYTAVQFHSPILFI